MYFHEEKIDEKFPYMFGKTIQPSIHRSFPDTSHSLPLLAEHKHYNHPPTDPLTNHILSSCLYHNTLGCKKGKLIHMWMNMMLILI